MTLTAEPAATVPDDPEPPARRGAGRRLAALAGVGAVVLGGGIALGTWYGGASATLDRVEVVLDAQPFACQQPSDAVTSHQDINGIAMALPAVRLHPGLACSMSFVVLNGSGTDVRLEQVRLPFMGVHSGAGVHAERILQDDVRPSSADDVAAAFDFEHDRFGVYGIGAGSATQLVADLSWSHGCMSPGATEWIRQAPIVTVSVDGVRRDVAARGAGYAFVGTASSSCDR